MYRMLSIWILRHRLVEHGDGLLGPLLVTRHLADLIEVARADQELRIGSVRTAGMKLDIAPGRVDGIIISSGLVVGVGRHDERFARPLGIGVLPINLLEALGRALGVLLDVKEVEPLIVDAISRLIEHRVCLGPPPTAKALAARGRRRDQSKGQRPSQARHSSHTKQRLIRRLRMPTHECPVLDALYPLPTATCHRPGPIYPRLADNP